MGRALIFPLMYYTIPLFVSVSRLIHTVVIYLPQFVMTLIRVLIYPSKADWL